MSSIANRLPFAKVIYKEYIKRLIKPCYIEDFQTTEAHRGLVRSAEFYEYKNYTKAYSLQLSGLKIWLKIDSGITVGDIWIEDEVAAEKGIVELKQLAKRLGIRKIVFLITDNHPAYTLLTRQTTPQKGNALLVRYTKSEMKIDWSTIAFSRGDYDTF